MYNLFIISGVICIHIVYANTFTGHEKLLFIVYKVTISKSQFFSHKVAIKMLKFLI